MYFVCLKKCFSVWYNFWRHVVAGGFGDGIFRRCIDQAQRRIVKRHPNRISSVPRVFEAGTKLLLLTA